MGFCYFDGGCEWCRKNNDALQAGYKISRLKAESWLCWRGATFRGGRPLNSSQVWGERNCACCCTATVRIQRRYFMMPSSR